MSVRFVIVGTMRRGALKKPIALDAANQRCAFSAWRMYESQAERVRFELGNVVVWNQEPGQREGVA